MTTHPSIALGSMQFLWTTTEKEAYATLDAYYDLGGRIIDTADMYTNWVDGLKGGEAEIIIGKWLRKRKIRESVILMSKVRARVWEGADGEGLSKAHIKKAIEKSLSRLRTDYLDIYISHWPDENTPIQETLLTYQQLIKEGKIRAIGCSNYSHEQLKEALEAGKTIGTEYTYIQAYYNLIDRQQFQEQLLPLITQFGLHTFIYGPLASGFLTGAYRKNKALPTHARAEFVKEKMTDENMQLLTTIDKLAKTYHCTVSQISLSWLLQQGYSPIIGADTASQVKENMGALAIKLSSEDMNLLTTA